MNNRQHLLAVTGATGFIGQGVMRWFDAAGIVCRGVSRSMRPLSIGQSVEWAQVPNYVDEAALDVAIAGATTILHLADNPNRGQGRNALDLARSTEAVIAAARGGGARQIILASSVYARDVASGGSYAAGKRAVEDAFFAATDLNPIILRLPPVYGPHSKGGLGLLARLIAKGLPLPLGLAHAPRAYLSLNNLASLIARLTTLDLKAKAGLGGAIFEPSDGQKVGTAELVGIMGRAMGHPARLLPVPVPLLRLLGGATGLSEVVASAVDGLTTQPIVEIEAATGWRPVEQMPESFNYLRDS